MIAVNASCKRAHSSATFSCMPPRLLSHATFKSSTAAIIAAIGMSILLNEAPAATIKPFTAKKVVFRVETT